MFSEARNSHLAFFLVFIPWFLPILAVFEPALLSDNWALIRRPLLAWLDWTLDRLAAVTSCL